MNEHQRRRDEMQKESRRFLSALSAGQAGARDRFNTIIQAGQKVLYHNAIDLIFDVVSVAPVLDPNVPPGFMDVMVTVSFPLRVMANQPNPNAIVMSLQEKTENEAEAPTTAPAEDPAAEPAIQLTDQP